MLRRVKGLGGWKGGRLEDWKIGRRGGVEDWKDGRVEEKIGRVEDWKGGRGVRQMAKGWVEDGRGEGWKDGRVEGGFVKWRRVGGRMEGWKDGRMEGWKRRLEDWKMEEMIGRGEGWKRRGEGWKGVKNNRAVYTANTLLGCYLDIMVGELDNLK